MKKYMKALTFSYDDGVTQDARLIEIFNKYGLKATFNINSGLLGRHNSLIREDVTVAHCRPRPVEIRKIYEGHEVAAHTLTHLYLPDTVSDEEVIRQVEEDRLALSDIMGYEVVGMAYPGGGVNNNERIRKLIRENTGIKYARTIHSSHSFAPVADLYELDPTVYHHEEFGLAFELAEKFIASKPTSPEIFYIWGHSYEFDIKNEWARFEELCKLLSGHDDILYATNSEILLSPDFK